MGNTKSNTNVKPDESATENCNMDREKVVPKLEAEIVTCNNETSLVILPPPQKMNNSASSANVTPDKPTMLQTPDFRKSADFQDVINLTERQKMESGFKPSANVTVSTFKRSGDYWADLNEFVEKHNLGKITHKTINAKKGRSFTFYSKLTVGDRSYSSYPEDNFDEASAIQTASRNALDDLEKLHQKDYEMLMGSDIPYKKLGYTSLEQFVCSIPSLSTTRSNGQLLVDAKVLDKSAHISNFVQKQKPKKRSRPPPRQNHNFNRGKVTPPRWRPGSVTHTWKTSYETSPRPAAYAHKQLVSSSKSPKKTNVHSRLGIKEDIKTQFSAPQFEVKQHQQATDNSLTKQAKRRLSQKMANLALDTNHVNDDPTAPQSPPFAHSTNYHSLDAPVIDPIERRRLESEFIPAANVMVSTFKRSGDYWADLNEFVEKHNLGEITLKTIKNAKKGRSSTFYSKLTVGDRNYSNYPEDNFDETSAIQVASRNALDDLEKLYQSKETPLLISDTNDILKRIPPMVQVHCYGVWSSLIEENYVKEYNEDLPKNWLEILDTLPYIAVQQTCDRYVLHYCSSTEKTNYSDPNMTLNVAVPPNTVNFNDDGMLIAEITCISSAAEIWCVQCETHETESFYQMSADMEKYYETQGMRDKASHIQMGGHYVAHSEQMWCRVRVFEVNDDKIHCFCIDFGDEWIVQKDNLYYLKKEFGDAPAQAFVCRLAGLEELYDISKTSEYLQSFLGVTVHVQEVSENSETYPNDPALPVVFYDTGTGDPINEQIITYMSLEIASASLVLNTPTEVYVTHALADGSVYIQIRSKGYEHLMSLIEKAGQDVLENKSSISSVNISKTNCTGLYFIREDNGLWYRIKIIDWPPNNEKYAQILFVDNGKSKIVEVKSTEFYVLSDISDVISKFPFQGLHVRLCLGRIPPNFVDRITELMPPDKAVVVKALKVDDDYKHIVEFFKRSESDNILFSVNLAIADDYAFKPTSGDGNNNKQSNKLERLISLNQFDDLSSKNVPSTTGSLSSPKIPEIGNYFDVKVPCAVHPHNFFVQLYESPNKLYKLMLDLQECYKDIQKSPVQMSDIVAGKIYASKHTDNKWYRTSVIKVIHAGSISVFYCDFGFYGNLTIQQLYPLDNGFMKLPYQAIKAKLADIKPKNSKWSMDDCSFFWKLVSKKSFVSLLMRIDKDVLYPSDIVLSLKLVDTSQSEDVEIDQVLINEGKAVTSIDK